MLAHAGITERAAEEISFLWLSSRLAFLTRASHEKWEMARMISFFSVVPYAKPNALKDFKDLIQFPWETPREQSVVEPMTQEEYEKFVREMMEFIQRQ